MCRAGAVAATYRWRRVWNGMSFTARVTGSVETSEAVKAATSVVGVPWENRARQ